jgi:hypothetical protein
MLMWFGRRRGVWWHEMTMVIVRRHDAAANTVVDGCCVSLLLVSLLERFHHGTHNILWYIVLC